MKEESKIVKVPKFINDVEKISTMIEQYRLPLFFIRDIKITGGDVVTLGVDIRNISKIMHDMVEYRVDNFYANDFLKLRNISTDYSFCFRFGPYFFIVQSRF